MLRIASIDLSLLEFTLGQVNRFFLSCMLRRILIILKPTPKTGIVVTNGGAHEDQDVSSRM